MTDTAAAIPADLSFEDALKRLETIVSRLESGQAPLEESIALYEEGAKLKAHCEARLKAAAPCGGAAVCQARASRWS